MLSYSCTCTFDVSFVCFAILNTIFKVKENFVHFLKSFLNWRFTFFICLKNNYNNIKAVNFFLSHTQIHLYSHGYFFSLPQPFIRIFFTSKPHIASICFRFSETQGSAIVSISGLLLLSRAP